MTRAQRNGYLVLSALLAGGLALLAAFADRDPRGLASTGEGAPAAAAEAPPAPRAAAGAPEVAPGPGPAPTHAAPGRAPLRAGGEDRSPQRSMPPSRRHALASFRRELAAGMAVLQDRLARCAGAAGPGGAGAAVLVALETVHGGIRVLDARAQGPGSASDAEVSCARAAVAGQVLPAPSAEPGRRWQLPLALRPPGA